MKIRRYLGPLAVVTMMATAWVSAQDQPLTLKVETALVSLEAFVLDSNGRPVVDLRKEDFAVYDNGELQEVSHFSPVATPYNMLLVVQNAGSLAQRSFLVGAVNSFINTVRGGDRIAVATFDGFGFKKVLDWRTEPPEQPKQIVLGDSRSQNGKLYDALGQSVKEFAAIAGRKGVIVLTDGRDSDLLAEASMRKMPDPAEDREFQKALEPLRAHDIPFYFIAVNAEPDLPAPSSSWNILRWKDVLPAVRTRLERFAESSGGRVFFAKTDDAVNRGIEQINGEMGMSYGLAYYPARSGSGDTPHRIEVRVRRENLRVVQSRSTYAPK